MFNAAASFTTLLFVHFRGYSGSFSVTGSISDSKSDSSIASFSSSSLRPAPDERIRLLSPFEVSSSEASNSNRIPAWIVVRDSPVAMA